MIEFFDAKLELLTIHRVGNKNREETCFQSDGLADLSEDLTQILLDYFCLPLMKVTEVNHFVHEVGLRFNEMNGIAKNIFNDKSTFLQNSVSILHHLFEQSEHPHIKTGDLFIVYFTDIYFQDDTVDAIGVFKSENKDSYLKLIDYQRQIVIDQTNGINPKKLDKACLILNLEDSDGYRVLTVDNNKYDAEYWPKKFLNIDFIKDNNFETKNCVNLCKSFAQEVIKEQGGKKEQIDFLNRSVKFFEENEETSIEDYKNSLFADSDSKQIFGKFKEKFEKDNDIIFSETFEISKPVLSKQKKTIKNYIKLDTNIQIKLDPKNQESNDKFIEKGFDDQKSMHYYKIFFNKELD